MNKIDIRAIQDGITSEDFVEAKKCPHLLYDENYGAALWHKCFCDFASKDRGMPQPCNLVWRGKCIQGKATPAESQHGREPDKVKPLAQYLDEYLSKYLNGETLPHELLEQALDAYESTENVKIRIKRV